MAMEKNTLKEPDKEKSESDWSSLPEDVKVDILCRLPENPLIAFKSVSKDWYFLISNACLPRLSPPSPSAPSCGVFGPAFTSDPSKSSIVKFSRHGKYDPYFYKDLQGCYRQRKNPDVVISYLDSLPFTCTTKNLQDCCNGLLLLSHTDCDSEPIRYFVGNPATSQTIPIPANSRHQNSILVDCSLVFDPSESLAYRIFRFVHSVGKATIKFVDVFSSDTGEWTEYKLPSEAEITGIGRLKSSVYLDGALYRIAGTGCLIRLNIRSHVGNLNAWSTIEVPNQQNKEYAGSIGASGGHLCYFSRDASEFLLWMLKNGDEWVMKYNISIYTLGQFSYGKYYCPIMGEKVWSAIQPCVLLPGSDEILLLETPWFLVAYKFKDKSYEWHTVHMPGCEIRRLGQSFPYSRCLVILSRSGRSSGSFRQ